MFKPFTYALVPFMFFPLAIAATYLGGSWPLAYVAFAVMAYVLGDFLTPAHEQPVAPKTQLQKRLYDGFLLLQIPLTVVLLIVLFAQIAPETGLARMLAELSGVPFQGYESIAVAIGAAITVGFHLSSSTVVAHEMMHRSSKFWKACSRTLLVINGDGHFQEAHLYGHHANVATPLDPATARRGESIYRFIVRSCYGQWREAFDFERRRVARRGSANVWLANRVVRASVATIALSSAVGLGFGYQAALAYSIVMVVAKLLLESINYIQHYGLTRDSSERVRPEHSWDCSARASSLYLFNLTRHSDHHARPKKPYWELETQSEALRMPHGYMLSIMIALIPPLWREYTEPLFRDQVRGAETRRAETRSVSALS